MRAIALALLLAGCSAGPTEPQPTEGPFVEACRRDIAAERPDLSRDMRELLVMRCSPRRYHAALDAWRARNPPRFAWHGGGMPLGSIANPLQVRLVP